MKKVKKAIVLGEVLYDIFPDKKLLGGAPFNFAYHLAQLGMEVSFVSRVGNDNNGEEILNRISSYGLSTEDIQVDPDFPTGEVTVAMSDNGSHSFEIKLNQAYDHIAFTEQLEKYSQLKNCLIYFGSLAQRNNTTREALHRLLSVAAKHNTVFMDLNLRAPHYNLDIIQASLKFTDILKISDEELETLKQLFSKEISNSDFIQHLFKEFEINKICLTKGEQGAQLFNRDGTTINKSASPVTIFVDAVGAGDSFSALLAYGLSNDPSIETTLERAANFAARICEQKGALPIDPSFYDSFKIV